MGCGNNSPRDAKIPRPDLVYTGLDVGYYNQPDSIRYADAYLPVPPAEFADAIAAHRVGSMQGCRRTTLSTVMILRCPLLFAFQRDAVHRTLEDEEQLTRSSKLAPPRVGRSCRLFFRGASSGEPGLPICISP